ncbi:MAG: hypothetical protein IAE77_16690 [Prosthecobacter sp.]|jgi:hypothetical protein|uniref:hypothetical protein n=1 Tax=Prosthecobacter sp. TaxID=1965333 RepID=UPI0019FD04DD|nr:hypothetical protein [Prosthecobacter sp.]MBE2285100.1 hypothetical protein [Prosthecobacter sp.]
MKASLRVLLAALLACFLSACPETTVDDDFGSKPSALKPDDWSGGWMAIDDDDVMHFTIADAENGVLLMTEPGDKDEKPVEFRLRRASADDQSGLLFALITEKDVKPVRNTLHLLRESDEGVLLVWSIDDEAVAKAIQAGQLKGTTERVKNDPHNHLASDAGNASKLLAPQFWRWTEPAILKRSPEKK